jgi:Recombination endonuclease VII.
MDYIITKRCKKCNEIKLLSEFYERRPSKDGYAYRCKKCLTEYGKERYRENSESYKKRQNNYYAKNKKQIRQKAREHLFKISEEEYSILYQLQKGECAICGVKESEMQFNLAIDHNHKTGEIRGLLCRHCNSGIGFLKENIDIFKKAILYILQDGIKDRPILGKEKNHYLK